MFGERQREKYQGEWVDVEKTLKYEESKKTAQGIIDKYESITEADFWILKNYNKYSEKMGYSGLIISHNGCLKLNDELPEELKFKPQCVMHDKDGWGNSLVFFYECPEQGIYEVGEVSTKNTSQSYPYAMAFKRLYDRVVLKNSKLAYGGIYSEVEADEFREPQQEPEMSEGEKALEEEKMQECTETELKNFREICEIYGVDHKAVWKQTGKAKDLTKAHMGLAMKWIQEHATATGRN